MHVYVYIYTGVYVIIHVIK